MFFHYSKYKMHVYIKKPLFITLGNLSVALYMQNSALFDQKGKKYKCKYLRCMCWFKGLYGVYWYAKCDSALIFLSNDI